MLDSNKMAEYVKPIEADLHTFDMRLSDFLKGDSPLISSIARHLLKSRGKRIRPAFLFLASRAGNFMTNKAVEASLAIELIHTATLLHDDVVDESDLRRGLETVNTKWTNLISVLMGDYLFAKAFRVMVETGSIQLMSSIAEATEKVSVGELRQIEETGNHNLSEDEYLSIIADKTASLFRVACSAGPILAERPKAEQNRFAHFGEKIGTAFQIADDLLDFVGDSELTGKEPGNDVMNGRVTLPLIHALKKSGKGARAEILKHLRDGDEESFNKVHRFVTETGGIDYAYRKAGLLGQQGFEAIANVGQSEYYDSLSKMVKFTTARVA